MRPLSAPAFRELTGNASLKLVVHALLLLAMHTWTVQAQEPSLAPAGDGLAPIRQYIHSSWDTLTRSMTRCDSVVDPKVAAPAVLYLPVNLPFPPAVTKLQSSCRVEVRHLPAVVHHPGELDPQTISPPGLLFLPNRYVVPGGRFNEMYGWDSYFIILGLLQDGRLELARNMVDNFLFEIEHYGTVLNANRTYMLSRSQPPFLTSMILAVYDAEKTAGREDRQWLEQAYRAASKDYGMWTSEPHLAADTGLSRYFDFGQGPVPEALKDEAGVYRAAATYFLRKPEEADHDIAELISGQQHPDAIGFPFTLQLCETTQTGNKCDPVRTLSLTRDYYKGDRSMRESGFDVSFRFGPYGAQTHHYAPVCLNSLLYKTEADLELISRILGKKDEAQLWQDRAAVRRDRINKYLWDERRGEFFDYLFEAKERSTYEYLTTFYPLWAGLASAEQAKSVEKNLPVFEQPGGLVMSRTESGAQWDYPYGWAPTTLLAIEGLRRYGFSEDADRLSYKFLSMIVKNFRRDGTLWEKYNVVTRSSQTNVSAGYHMNVVGFGWTNAAFEKLLSQMSPQWRHKLESGSEARMQ